MLKDFGNGCTHPVLGSDDKILNWIMGFQDTVKAISLLRFSNKSKSAFNSLRLITKYDSFLKRDGSIITAVKDPVEGIITDPNEVSQRLLNVLRENDANAK